MNTPYYLGLDLGSISLDLAVLDSSGEVVWTRYSRTYGRPIDAVAMLCQELVEEFARPMKLENFSGVLATGSGKEILQDLLGINMVNEIVAHGTAGGRLAGGKASIIEIGGQDSKFLLVDQHGPFDYSMNELCAAGTGAFLDVQAQRLGMEIEDFAKLAAQAKKVPPVAGRCSVFAKSDIIHLQQKGVPVDEIVAGLCYALARNYIASLIRGRVIQKPVVFQGGVALNQGVIRAFKELLKLKEDEVILPPHPHMMGAIGAALLSSEKGKGLSIDDFERMAREAPAKGLQKLQLEGWEMEGAEEDQNKSLEEFELFKENSSGPLYLGIDIGSVSTDALLMDSQGDIVAHVYTFTASRPIEATKRALEFLSKHFEVDRIKAVGTTGSGRKLIGHLVGADIVVDEITAQARGARKAFPDADTVIEIGGQDAKFIQLEGGFVREFEMNRACSAGTGSFIQEQAFRLGVDLKKDFARLALSAKNPLPLASRCTVFMESDLVHHIQRGATLENILMGVAYSVVENYLDRVARDRKPGKKAVIQGGVAKNQAVVEAFRQKLKETEIHVHPSPGLSGALGVALLALEEFGQKGEPTTFKGFEIKEDFERSAFVCKMCENQCEVNLFDTSLGKFYIGDLCGRYSETVRQRKAGTDYTKKREDLLRDLVSASRGTQTIGIPEALLFKEYFPFWFSFFDALEIKLVTSGPSNTAKLYGGLSKVPAETCLPVKFIFGHVAELVKKGIEKIFIPASDKMADGLTCLYVQHAASMMASAFRDLEVLSFPLLPGMKGRRYEILIEEVSSRFGLPREQVAEAYHQAEGAHKLYQNLTSITPDKTNPVALLIGKPYNTADRFINLSLSSKLARAGFDVVLADQIKGIDEVSLPKAYNRVTWYASRKMIKGAIYARQEGFYPVVIGNFGCGPDSFTLPIIEEILGTSPALFLEVDEHRADAGYDTRVEAFYEVVCQWRKLQENPPVQGPLVEAPKKFLSLKKDEGRPHYIIPFFSDHAHAFAGAIRAEGYSARVLPPPDRHVLEASLEFSGGKQCHPFQTFAGDIIRLVQTEEVPQGSVYFFPSTGSSCPITQYAPTIQGYLNKLGRPDIKVLETTSVDILFHTFGMKFLYSLGRGIVGIEYLLRLRYELRPYEVQKGSVDAAYGKALKNLENYQVQGQVYEGIMRGLMEMEKVPTKDRGTRPAIGIAGDVYTRVNPAANGGLFELIEDLGCEVWLSPTLWDISLTGTEIEVGRFWKYREIWEMVCSWGKVFMGNRELGQVQKHFKGLLRNLTEPDAETVEKHVKGLFFGDPDLLVLLNAAKHVDFSEKGVDGILNVFCLNCMVGTSTAAVFPALKERMGDLPMMSLVFDGMGTTHSRNRIEAFIHRVVRHRKEKLERQLEEEEKRSKGLLERMMEHFGV